jgi:hypothetical protein
VLWLVNWSWDLILPPFSHEIDYSLTLDCSAWLEVD